jgi:hypothetical protein
VLESNTSFLPFIGVLEIGGSGRSQWAHDSPSMDTLLAICRILPCMTGLRRFSCYLMPMIDTFYQALFTHPSLTHICINSPWTFTTYPATVDRVKSVAGGGWRVSLHPESNLQSFSTNSKHLLSVLTDSGIAPHLRRLVIQTLHTELDISELLSLWTLCPLLQHLSFSILDSMISLPAEALPCLQSFQGSPQHAAIIIPGRPVVDVRIESDLGYGDGYDLLIPAALEALSRSLKSIRSLSLTMFSEQPGPVQGLCEYLPNLEHLSISYRRSSPPTTVSYTVVSINFWLSYLTFGFPGRHQRSRSLKQRY